MKVLVHCFISAILLYTSASRAFFPVCEDRYVTLNDSFKVRSTSEQAELTTEASKSREIWKQSLVVASKSSSNVSNNSSSELYLKPGISVLHTDSSGLAYFVNVTVGDDVFPLLIDTGSAYLWVYGDQCNSSACQGKELFSTAFVEREQSTFSLQYSSGVASGDVYEDRIIVNKLATTENFTFGVADEVPSTFTSYPVSGIFGLPSNNSQNIQSIISALRQSNAISVEKFSIYLGHLNISGFEDASTTEYETASVNEGIFAIGDEIQELYTGELYYNNLLSNDNNYWSLEITDIYIDDFAINFTNYENFTGSQSHYKRSSIVDSGTTLLILPKQDALDVHAFFENSVSDGTNFAVFCNSTEDIILNWLQNWTITPESYLGSAYPDSSIYSGYCVSNIQGLDINEAWILGNVFLGTVYSVFDVENQKLGFADRNENAVLAPSSNAVSNVTTNSSTTSSTASGTTTVLTKATSSSSSSHSSSVGFAAELKPKGFLLTISIVIGFLL